jgi:ubiquinone/menaquinone biosynthesis C-methylase UbiE
VVVPSANYMEINIQPSDFIAGRSNDSARAELAHPLADAIGEWFDHYPLPQIPGLSVGAGPNNFFEPSRNLSIKMLGSFDCGLKILDLGCGFGDDAITLSGETNRIWGIDIAEHRLHAARAAVHRANRSDRIFIEKMDAHDLQFADNFFDLIVGNSFLMWVNKARAVEECHRVLKPGGKALFPCESMGKNPFLALYRHRQSMQTRESLVSRITLPELSRLASRFSAAQWEQFYLVSPLLYPLAMRFPKNGILRRIIRSVHFLDMGILRLFPRSRHHAWVSVVEFIK